MCRFGRVCMCVCVCVCMCVCVCVCYLPCDYVHTLSVHSHMMCWMPSEPLSYKPSPKPGQESCVLHVLYSNFISSARNWKITVSVRVCVCVCVFVHAYVRMCACVHMYIYACICMYIYMHKHRGPLSLVVYLWTELFYIQFSLV